MGIGRAHVIGIGRVGLGGTRQQLTHGPAGAKAHRQTVHHTQHLFELDGMFGQLRQQGQEVGGGLEIKLRPTHFQDHFAHGQQGLRDLVVLQQGQGVHHFGQTLDALQLRVLFHQAFEILDAALQSLVVAALELHKGHEHQGLAVEDLGVQTEQAGAAQNVLGLVQVAGVKRHHAQTLQAAHRRRCELAGHLVGGQGVFKLAQLELRTAHDVVGIGIAGVVGNQVFQRADRRLHLAAVQHGARYPELGPGQGLGLDDGFVQLFGLGWLVHAQQEFGADAGRIQPVRTLALETRNAQLGGGLKLTRLNGREDLLQGHFAHPRLLQTLTQLRGLVRLEQVAVQRRLGGLGHLGVGGLAGDHDKHGRKRQQLVAPQVVQQVLA